MGRDKLVLMDDNVVLTVSNFEGSDYTRLQLDNDGELICFDLELKQLEFLIAFLRSAKTDLKEQQKERKAEEKKAS